MFPLTQLAGCRRVAATLTTVLALAMALSACTSADQVTSATGYRTGETLVSTLDVAERPAAPALAGSTLDGGSLDLSELRGQVVVMNVWASWCGPCRGEADDLVEAHDILNGVAFVGLDTHESDKSLAQAFVRTHDIPYDSLYDDDGTMLLEFDGLVSPNSLPSTVVIDTTGKIAALVTGPLTTSTLVGLVEDVQAEA